VAKHRVKRVSEKGVERVLEHERNRVLEHGTEQRYRFEDHLDCYCHNNASRIQGDIRRIVLEFQGLNRYQMLDQPSPLELELTDKHILYVIPYTAPWSWMNHGAAAYTNLLLDSIFQRFQLPEDTPVISTGYSMGGQAALMYTQFSTRKITACYANSPVCDLAAHWQERMDVPRTLVSAFIDSPLGIEEEIRTHSPLQTAANLPDIPYLIIAGAKDTEVHKHLHSDKLADRLRRLNRQVTYHELPDMAHWQITDYGVYRAYVDFITGAG